MSFRRTKFSNELEWSVVKYLVGSKWLSPNNKKKITEVKIRELWDRAAAEKKVNLIFQNSERLQ